MKVRKYNIDLINHIDISYVFISFVYDIVLDFTAIE